MKRKWYWIREVYNSAVTVSYKNYLAETQNGLICGPAGFWEYFHPRTKIVFIPSTMIFDSPTSIVMFNQFVNCSQPFAEKVIMLTQTLAFNHHCRTLWAQSIMYFKECLNKIGPKKRVMDQIKCLLSYCTNVLSVYQRG